MAKILVLFFFLYSILNAHLVLTKDEKDWLNKHQNVTFAIDRNWTPLVIKQEDGSYIGLDVDFLDLINKKLNTNFSLVYGDWEDLVIKAKNKEVDVLASSAVLDSRKKYFNFTKAYYKTYKYIFTKDNFTIKSLNDLEGKTVAIQSGIGFDKKLLENIPNIKFVYVDDKYKKISLLLNNEIDAFIGANSDKYLLKKEYITNVKISHVLKQTVFNAVYSVRKDWLILVNILNKTIDDISKNEKNELYTRWIDYALLDGKKDIFLTKSEAEFIKNHTINIAFGTPWEPFHVRLNGKDTGIAFDFWNLIKEKTGIKSQSHQLGTFTKALNSIKEKQYDILLSVGETKDRKKYANFSKVYSKFPISIATSKNQSYISNINVLEGKKIAIGKNFTAHKMMKRKYPYFKYVLVDNVKQGLDLVSSNKAFAFIDNMPVLAYNINKYGFTNLKIAGNTGEEFEMSFMIRDDYHELLSILNKAIDSFSEDEFKPIYNKWIAVVYNEEFDYKLFFTALFVIFLIILIVVFKNRQLVKYQEQIKEKNKVLIEQTRKLEDTNFLLKSTQGELEKSLESFKVLVNSTIEAVVILEKEKIKYANRSFLGVFDYKNQMEVYEVNIDEFLHNKSDFLLLDKNPKEISAVKKDGSVFPILVKKESLLFQGKNATIISIIDLSDLKDKEQLLLQQSKMAAMGEMIGNIAHQWRQPLSAVTTAASGMKLRYDLDDFSKEVLDESVDAIIRNSKFLSQTIDDFRNYLKNSKVKQEFLINEVISQSINLVKPVLDNKFIKVHTNIEEKIFVNSYFNELNQALINILNNAKDALIENQDDEKYVFFEVSKDENSVYISIYDNANGIPNSIMEYIFEPYFTTKHQSQGTGLGLYMTYKIITDSLKGEIKVKNIEFIHENKKHKGAKFTIRLPFNI